LNLTEFSKRVLVASGIVLGVILSGLFIWFAFDIILIIFAGCLLAVLFHGVSSGIAKYTPLPTRFWLTLLIILSLAGIISGTWFYGRMFYSHFNQLTESLTAAANQLMAQYEFARKFFSEITRLINQLSQLDILANIRTFFSTTIGFLFNAFIIYFLGIYIAIEPHTYVNGFLQLFPAGYQPRMKQVISHVYHMLKWWLLGRIVSMISIGLLTVIGLWILNIPLPLTLATLAAMLEFIPYLGPILSAFPAIIIALTVSPLTSLYVAILYFIIQQIEGYVITPIIHEEAIAMPPAITLAIQIFFGILAGSIGLIMASPFSATLIVLIQMLYVQDIQHNDVKVLGEH